MYLGFEYQASPVTSDYVKVTWALEADFTPTAKTNLFALLLSGTAPPSVYAQAVGSAIGSSGYSNKIKLQTPSSYVDSGGEPNPDGPKLVGNTLTLSAKIDTSNDSFLNCVYISGDTSAP